MYRDKELKTLRFTEQEFSEISYAELSEIVGRYNEAVEVFSDINLKKIAVNGFFLNAFLMSDNDPVKFFGKSILDLTVYQMNPFGKGKFYKSILEEGKDPPDYMYDSIEENGLEPIVNWFDGASAQIKSERERQKMASRGRGGR